MPITSKDFRALNVITRRPPHALPVILRRVFQGVGGKVMGKEMAAGGAALAAGLIAGARKAGVDIWLNNPLRELVVEDGEVTGVVVEKDGARVRVAAKGGSSSPRASSTTPGTSAAGTSRRRSPRTGATATPTTPATCSRSPNRWARASISSTRRGGSRRSRR
jgi:hypothetical protein